MASKPVKRSFTLLEILIVVLLIGLATSVVAFQMPKLLRGESFGKGVEQVMSKIVLAGELMLDFDTDVDLVWTQEGKWIKVILDPRNPVPEKVKRLINRYAVIKGIEEIEFDGGRLHFDKTLGATPHCELTLKGGGQSAKLYLRGFPSKPLKKEETHGSSQTAHYPEEVLSLT